MRILSTVGTAILGLAACCSSDAQNRENSDQVVNVQRVAGNVYMLDTGTSKFNGGNVAVLVGSDGLLLVDTGNKANSQAIVATLAKLSDKPVRYVINTHCHADHMGGNAILQSSGATIVAHGNVRKRLEQAKCDKTDAGLPTITLETDLTLHFDAEEVTVTKLPTSHTDGDVIVYFKNANVVHVGDVFVSINLPFHSKYAGGKILGIADSLRAIVRMIPEDAKVIPGHGPPCTISDIRRAIKILDEVKSAVLQQVGKGKTLSELREENLLNPWKESLGANDLDYYLRNFYEELGGKAAVK